LVEIREEHPDDVAAIRDVNARAFGRLQEADLVDALRSNGAVSLSLVATVGREALGHILYSPVRVGQISGTGLGPMAVAPEHQRRRIGSQLVETGNRMLKELGCPFVVVLGHPDFYPRFGFKPASTYGVACQWAVPDNVFMLSVLDAEALRGLSGLAEYRPEFSSVS
jgi:putative acetyltransferase